MKSSNGQTGARGPISQRGAGAAGAILLASLILLGGASRADALTQPLLRIICLALVCWSVLDISKAQLHRFREPAIFLGCFAALCVVQLVPLPPSPWASLPGRDSLAGIATNAGVAVGWRALSLSPDRTMNALLACLPALATLLVLARMSQRQFARVPFVLLGAVFLCAILGLTQVYAGWPYPYRITNLGNAVGFFANRNHAALLLAMGIPIVAHLAVSSERLGTPRQRLILAVCVTLGIVALLLTNGSRAGLATGLIGLLGAGAMVKRFGAPARGPRGLPWVLLGAFGLLMTVIVIFWLSSRGLSFERAAQTNDGGELRLIALPTILEMIRTYFPIGSGLGTFDAAFKIFEPDAMVSTVYFNHAHNDYLELLSDAGLFGLALLAAFILWVARRSLVRGRLWRRWSSECWMALVMLAQVAVASAFDYPVRVPFISATLMYLAAVLAVADDLAKSRGSGSTRTRNP